MTNYEFHFYKDLALRLFNYMNGRVNRMNNRCILYIDMYDYITNNYATIRYPNHVFLHIGTIIDKWEDKYSCYISRHDYIVTLMAWALAHELSHADQAIQMLMYANNEAYKADKESDVQRYSFDWVKAHQYELSMITKSHIQINVLNANNLPKEGHYRKATVEEFYKQTIANTIIKDLQLFNKVPFFVNDNAVDDIIIGFNGRDCITIKRCGKYVEENISVFSEATYRNVSFFDNYTISINIETIISEDGRKVGIVDFVIQSPSYYPMTFKK